MPFFISREPDDETGRSALLSSTESLDAEHPAPLVRVAMGSLEGAEQARHRGDVTMWKANLANAVAFLDRLEERELQALLPDYFGVKVPS